MNNSVITQVDESTKGLMEEIQSGISSSIEDGIRDVRQTIESVEDKTYLILSKFKNFDGLNSSAEQLRSLAEESKKITGLVSPLQSGLTAIQRDSEANEQKIADLANNLNLLIKGIVELGEKQNTIASELKKKIEQVQQTNKEQFATLTESLEKVQATLDIIVNFVTPFWKKWI